MYAYIKIKFSEASTYFVTVGYLKVSIIKTFTSQYIELIERFREIEKKQKSNSGHFNLKACK